MFYWIIYIVSAIVGLLVSPYFYYVLGGHPSDPSFISEAQVTCNYIGIFITTIVFSVQIKHYKSYRYIPIICLVGLFSFLPGCILGLLLNLYASTIPNPYVK
jgi:hypothetical protein